MASIGSASEVIPDLLDASRLAANDGVAAKKSSMEKRVTSRCAFTLDNLKVDQGVAIHCQIYAATRDYILDGRLGPNRSLPTTRSLAQSLGVGRNTAIAAYDQLLAEGYVQALAGSRTWLACLLPQPLAPRRRRKTVKARRQSRRGELPRTPAILNSQPGIPDTSAFPFSAWASLRARFAKRRHDDILGIYDYVGHPRLRQTKDCATQVILSLPSAATAGRSVEIFPRVIAGKNGRHNYTEWVQVLMGAGATHPAMNPFDMTADAACRRRYSKDICAQSHDILNRTVMVPRHPRHTDQDIDE